MAIIRVCLQMYVTNVHSNVVNAHLRLVNVQPAQILGILLPIVQIMHVQLSSTRYSQMVNAPPVPNSANLARVVQYTNVHHVCRHWCWWMADARQCAQVDMYEIQHHPTIHAYPAPMAVPYVRYCLPLLLNVHSVCSH